MITILIVDDHAIVRQGLKQILADTSDMSVGGEASTAQAALDAIQSATWDVIVLDLSLPDRSGIEVLQHIRHLPDRPPVLVLTMHTEEQYGTRLLHMGADGYLTKQAAPQELVTAIRQLAQGHKYVSPTLSEYLVAMQMPDAARPRHTVLSDREFQVLCLLAAGKTITKVAAELSIGITTVSTHRANILRKMHMRSVADLIQYAIWHRLVPWCPEAPTPSYSPSHFPE